PRLRHYNIPHPGSANQFEEHADPMGPDANRQGAQDWHPTRPIASAGARNRAPTHRAYSPTRPRLRHYNIPHPGSANQFEEHADPMGPDANRQGAQDWHPTRPIASAGARNLAPSPPPRSPALPRLRHYNIPHPGSANQFEEHP